MAQGIIADNWSLQEIATLMTEGLDCLLYTSRCV